MFVCVKTEKLNVYVLLSESTAEAVSLVLVYSLSTAFTAILSVFLVKMNNRDGDQTTSKCSSILQETYM